MYLFFKDAGWDLVQRGTIVAERLVLKRRKLGGTARMSKYAKVLAAKPGDPSSNPTTHELGGEKGLLQVVFQPLLASCGTQTPISSTK